MKCKKCPHGNWTKNLSGPIYRVTLSNVKTLLILHIYVSGSKDVHFTL